MLHLYYAVFAIGVVDEAFVAWRAYRLHVAALMAMVVLGSFIVAFGLLGIWLNPLMERTRGRRDDRCSQG